MTYRMLVVEDNELMGLTVKALFKSLGFDVHLIKNGAEALGWLEKNPVDVMILDLELPGMTGDKIHDAVKNNPRLRDVSIIPFTTHREVDERGSIIDKLMTRERARTGRLPDDVVWKTDYFGEPSGDINKDLANQVALKLAYANKTLPQEMIDYFREHWGMSPEEALRQARFKGIDD